MHKIREMLSMKVFFIEKATHCVSKSSKLFNQNIDLSKKF